jgi:chemotaxis receptor (MCP) glutamine deamidase CheD
MGGSRELSVAPDRFEVVSDDAILVAELSSAIAVCIYDAMEEAGALLHLRFIVRTSKPADVTDTTLATELLLLDRCVESLRETVPTARNLQAKIAAQLPAGYYLTDAGMEVSPTDATAGTTRHLRFRPCMGWVQIR